MNGEPPSAKKILVATGGALAVAGLLLVTVILPAEYGIDWLGTGRLLGVSALADVRPGVVAFQEAEHRTDARQFVLGPFESVEYKYRINKGGSMLFDWKATGPVVAELHSEPDGAPKGYAETFDKQESAASNGTYTAPFSGIHGWFWENLTTKEVTISLTTAGFYSGALEFYAGAIIEHNVKDARGQLIQKGSK